MAVHESWCPRCRVTHPPERKVCVHCGGRTEPHREGAQVFDAQAARDTQRQLRTQMGQAPVGSPPPIDAADEETEPEPRTVRGARLGLTLVWIALALGASLLRMCQESG